MLASGEPPCRRLAVRQIYVEPRRLFRNNDMIIDPSSESDCPLVRDIVHVICVCSRFDNLRSEIRDLPILSLISGTMSACFDSVRIDDSSLLVGTDARQDCRR